MDEKSFNAVVKRLERVNEAVGKLEPEIRSPAFALMSGYISGSENERSREGTIEELVRTREALEAKLDSLSELGELESLRLQMAMDRLSKLMSTLSNLMKKVSETQATIVQNLK